MRFTVRRPPNGEVSPCCHRPPGGDVACRVHIGIAAEPAAHAPKHRLALAAFRCDMATVRTLLRCVPGFDLLHPTDSFFSQTSNQHPPPVGEDTAVQPCLLPDLGTGPIGRALGGTRHVLDVELFNSENVEPTCKISAGLLDPNLPSVCFARFELRDLGLDPLTPVRTRHTPSQTSLERPKSPLFPDRRPGTPKHLPGGQRRRYHHSTIHSNHSPVTGRRNWIRLGGKGDMPPPRYVLGDPVGPYAVRNISGPSESHPTNFRNPHLPETAVQFLDVLRSNAYLTETFIPPSLAPHRTTVGAGAEVGQRLMKISQRLLLHRHRTGAQPRELRSRLRQLTSLFVVTRCRKPPWPPVGMLLNREVPNESRVRAMRQQHSFLGACRQQPIPRHRDQHTGRNRQCCARGSNTEQSLPATFDKSLPRRLEYL